MKPFSILSMVFIILGLFFIALNWIIEDFSEPILIIGAISLLIGCVLSYIAISKKEKGSLKFISIASFFIILFLVTWYEPFQVLRIITWLKNIA
ncbi:hypothetical protein KD050_03500 [Psychrobacillus sp. INOP01]|uniref:hypothetical protein n=1 Tax=Psychrobacillus sp. INOP01 TaxID=2829187 RepID=UPI001BA4E7A7|nr:hypothetical protein [Psychrobacillus sp. INOP01]QUG42370.1 hypothetical protein KD050_03500 [Psychrobacillus sp. INOP01]